VLEWRGFLEGKESYDPIHRVFDESRNTKQERCAWPLTRSATTALDCAALSDVLLDAATGYARFDTSIN
jgi:hypothetical protein